MALVLGIDVSTTATKAVLVDEHGALAGTGTAEYGYDIPHPGWSEQDPQLWWDGAVAAVSAALASAGVNGDTVAAVGLTGQMHGAVLLDENDAVLRPAILWNDQRTGRECQVIRDAVGAERLIEVTGNDALTGFTAPKLVWVRDNEPDVWARTRHVLLPKDYLRLRLTGEHAMDKADGSGTILFDLAARDWSPEVLAALRIDRGLMPPTFEGPAVTGTVNAVAAAATGLVAGTPVVAGGGDQSANAVGVGAVAPGLVALSLGTSGVVFAATDAPLYEQQGRVHAFCHAVPDRWHMMSVMLSAAGSLRWFRDALAPGVGFAELAASATDVEAAADGLYFLPYLTGERSPHPDADARGAFVGLDRESRPAAHDAGGSRGGQLRPARRARVDGRRWHAATHADKSQWRRACQPAVASDPGGRAECRDRRAEHDRGCRVRGRRPGHRRGRLVRHRRRRSCGPRQCAACGRAWAVSSGLRTTLRVVSRSISRARALVSPFRGLTRSHSAPAVSNSRSITRMLAIASDEGNGSGILSSTAAANCSA